MPQSKNEPAPASALSRNITSSGIADPLLALDPFQLFSEVEAP